MSHPATDHRALENEISRLRQQLSVLQDRLAHQAPPSGSAWGDSIFHAVYDQAQHFAGILDPTGRLQHANRVACALVDLPSAALVGQPFWDTPWWSHSPHEQDHLRAAIAREADALAFLLAELRP